MFSRTTLFAWIGVIFLSGMFLMGQETWSGNPCVDADGDSFYAIDPLNCPQGSDCDDNNRDIHPWKNEICGDGVDNDCSGTADDKDWDGDQHLDEACGGDDCVDFDADVYPGAQELCDGVDNQCPGDGGHGEVDEGPQCMVQIPAGCFDMGDSSDGCAFTRECPVHNVCVPAFEMDIHEVTNEQYRACHDAGACTGHIYTSRTRSSYYRNSNYDNYPVIYVDWNNATDYCTWVGKRLPTEAEWEYAARGGLAGKRYTMGDALTCDDANYGRGEDHPNAGPCYDYGGLDNDTHAVMSYPPNGYGLYDMTGNVSERVEDDFHGSYDCDANPDSPGCDVGGVAPTDGSAWIDDPRGPYRLGRGGGFANNHTWQTVAGRRGPADPSSDSSSSGFRCAR